MITHRLSCDNFPSKGSSKFSGGVGLRKLFYTFSLLVVQGFCRILPDFRGVQQLSIPLKVLMAKGFPLVQQALPKFQTGPSLPCQCSHHERHCFLLKVEIGEPLLGYTFKDQQGEDCQRELIGTVDTMLVLDRK